MSRLTQYLSLFILILNIISCKKDSGDTVQELSSDYFPMNQYSYIDYAVTEITYDDFFNPVKIDTINYELRVEVDSLKLNQNGFSEAQLIRSVRESDTSNWRVADVWFARKSNTKLEVVEENINFIKMVYPVGKDKTWDGNAMNTMPEQIYSYLEVNSEVTIREILFPNVVKVERGRILNLIEDESHQEWYAEGLGMIYKNDRSLSTSPDGEIESGRIVTYVIQGYGK